ncbi:hypothetical protein ONA91_04880 [Micromonospora sp. DR5-3]|uniref:DUF7144 family membrane protein n=1 Tax=unclassified Micromonospora TaxID=2617518 RepID=UPI0011D3CE80|nr:MULTISPECIES: hypothetical protein [unclassified Micromonospora]MCW3813790.1 hypothetical protein [Micromonospora sp. DR5-3]TYC25529.1 hypothetical protein FXF52_03620 [Micromonospora sp. MP36]
MTQHDEARMRNRQRMLAAVLLAGGGLADAVSGITDLDDDPYVVITKEGLYHLDLTGWLWAHLVTGVLMVLGGVLLFSGRRWSVWFAALVAVLGVAMHVVLLPFRPVWALMVIGLAVAALVLVRRCRRQTPSDQVNSTGRSSR